MGWSFRKSVKLAPGVRLNLSKRGLGISGGVRGARVSVGPRGTRFYGSLPGGLRYQRSLSGQHARSERDAVLAQYPPRSPWVAALLGIFPGGGQFYLRQWGWGSLVLLTCWLIVPWLLGWVIGIRQAAAYAAVRRAIVAGNG